MAGPCTSDLQALGTGLTPESQGVKRFTVRSSVSLGKTFPPLGSCIPFRRSRRWGGGIQIRVVLVVWKRFPVPEALSIPGRGAQGILHTLSYSKPRKTGPKFRFGPGYGVTPTGGRFIGATQTKVDTLPILPSPVWGRWAENSYNVPNSPYSVPLSKLGH